MQYIAPEVLLNRARGNAIDWWSLGTLMYEMMVGIPPFYSENVQEMYQMILRSDLVFPPTISSHACSLLSKVCFISFQMAQRCPHGLIVHHIISYCFLCSMCDRDVAS
jgi:serine/threonine protein kinase